MLAMRVTSGRLLKAALMTTCGVLFMAAAAQAQLPIFIRFSSTEPFVSRILNAPLARLDMAGTKTIGSGPTGTSVTLQLPVSFMRGAANRTYDVEVAAESDGGIRDEFMAAGVLVVER
jgi:hypothetical protein